MQRLGFSQPVLGVSIKKLSGRYLDVLECPRDVVKMHWDDLGSSRVVRKRSQNESKIFLGCYRHFVEVRSA